MIKTKGLFFVLSQVLKKSLILTLIPNANLEIDNPMIDVSIIVLNTNYSKIQQSYVIFDYLIKIQNYYE
jgi:hypothetical protein